MSYIDREKLKEYVNSISTHWLNGWNTIGVLAAIDKQPTEDVAPIKHGEWCEVIKPNQEDYYFCPLCGRTVNYKENYCPDCGAKMKSEVNNG